MELTKGSLKHLMLFNFQGPFPLPRTFIVSHQAILCQGFFRFFSNLFPRQLYHHTTYSPLCQHLFEKIFEKFLKNFIIFEKPAFLDCKMRFFYNKNYDIIGLTTNFAPIAQWIEHSPPTRCALVQFQLGVPWICKNAYPFLFL